MCQQFNLKKYTQVSLLSIFGIVSLKATLLNSPERETFNLVTKNQQISFNDQESEYLKKTLHSKGDKDFFQECKNLQQKKAAEEQRLKAEHKEHLRLENERLEKLHQEKLQQEQQKKIAEAQRLKAIEEQRLKALHDERLRNERQEKQRQEILRQQEQQRKAAEDKRVQAELVEHQRQEKQRQENLQLEQQKLIEDQRLKVIEEQRKVEHAEHVRQEKLEAQRAELRERQRLKAIEEQRLKDEHDKHLRLEVEDLEKLRQEKERLKIEHLAKEKRLKVVEEDHSKLQQEVLRLKIIEKQHLKAKQDEHERQEKLETQRCEAELKERQRQESLRQDKLRQENDQLETERLAKELIEKEEQHQESLRQEQQNQEMLHENQEAQKASSQQNSNLVLDTFQHLIRQDLFNKRSSILPPVPTGNEEIPVENDENNLSDQSLLSKAILVQHSPQQSLEIESQSQIDDPISKTLQSLGPQMLQRTDNLEARLTSIETTLKERSTTRKLSVITRPSRVQLHRRPSLRPKSYGFNLHKGAIDDSALTINNILENHNPQQLQVFNVQTAPSLDEEINVGPSRNSSPKVLRNDSNGDLTPVILLNSDTDIAYYSPNVSPNRRTVGSPLRSPHVRRILFNENPKIEIVRDVDPQENVKVTGAKATITTIMIMPPQFNWQRFMEHWEYAETGLLRFIKSSKFDNNLSYNLSYFPGECMTLIRKNATYHFLVPSFAYKNAMRKIHIPHLD